MLHENDWVTAPARKRPRRSDLIKQDSEDSTIPAQRSSRIFQASLSSRPVKAVQYSACSKKDRTSSPRGRRSQPASNFGQRSSLRSCSPDVPVRVTRRAALRDRDGKVKAPPRKPKLKKGKKVPRERRSTPPGSEEGRRRYSTADGNAFDSHKSPVYRLSCLWLDASLSDLLPRS
jgi:hypothetical protein